MTKSIQVEDDVHKDLEFLKSHFRKRSMSDTIRQIMYHAGFRVEWFETAERWREANLPKEGGE
jgi:predicted CopG family antitoxin